MLPSWLCELAGQEVQAALPSESLKVFDGQLEHEPGSPVVPAGQMFLQSDSASLPTPDIVPPEHGVQLASDDAPTAEDHVSRGQGVHSRAPADSWNLPALQTSHSVLTPAVLLYLPALQTSHSVLTPAVLLYLPALQLSHTVLTPAVSLNLPASQMPQVVAACEAWCLPASHS